MTKNHELWDDPPNPPKTRNGRTSSLMHRRRRYPIGAWRYDTISNGPPIGNAPIIGRVGYWRPNNAAPSSAEVKESGRRFGACWRRLCTLTRTRFDPELGIEIDDLSHERFTQCHHWRRVIGSHDHRRDRRLFLSLDAGAASCAESRAARGLSPRSKIAWCGKP